MPLGTVNQVYAVKHISQSRWVVYRRNTGEVVWNGNSFGSAFHAMERLETQDDLRRRA